MKKVVLLFVILLSCVAPMRGQELSLSYEPPNAVNLLEYLPENFVRDGTEDYTSYIQRGIDDNEIVIFPDFPILINEIGIDIPSNRKVYFADMSSIIMKPNNKERYEILRIHGEENILIVNPIIKGDRYQHKGNSGQWGMGISIRGGKNIVIEEGCISQCWGDGIYIGGYEDDPSRNIVIRRTVIDHARRNGISITSGESIEIDGIHITNTGGQAPESGIDIEPNSNRDVINNITLTNVTTSGSARYGLIISLNRLIGHRSKNVNIFVQNHRDFGSNIGFGMSSLNRGVEDNFNGSITVKNCTWDSVTKPFHYTKHNYSLNVSFNNISGNKMGRPQNLEADLRKIRGVMVNR